MPAVLRGMRGLTANGDVSALTAVVTMADDGGSSGRLRRSRGVLPPGDVRNCLVALSEEEDLLAGLFQHRYEGSAELGGHSLGNLILTALAEQTGSFLKAVEVSSRVLRTVGRILPATLDDVSLEAILDDGSTIRGECVIGDCDRKIERVRLSPDGVRETPGVAEAILNADLVIIGPGSLFTSLLPILVVEGIASALRRTGAARVLVGNLVTEHGEAAELDLRDHLELIESHAEGKVVDAVLVHEGSIDARILQRYEAEGVKPLGLAEKETRLWHVVRRNLLAPELKLRHDPVATAEGLLTAWRVLTLRGGLEQNG